jgi:hypothetical protein
MGLVRTSLDFDCDWRFGFNTTPGANGMVGYLLFWSGCGGLSLNSDIQVWNPYNTPGQTVVTGAMVTCIGVIERFHFDGDDDDPIRISVYVSKDNAASIRAKLSSPVTSTTVQVGWYIISFDDDRNAWYEAAYLQGGANASANLDTTNGELQISIANVPVRIQETIDLKVYKFEFQLIPAAGATSTLQFATGPTQKIVKTWGSSEDD